MLRIFPTYALYLIILLPVIIDTHPDVPAWTFPLFVSNFWLAMTPAPIVLTVAWSLAIEEQFYVLWPSCVRWLTSSRLMLACGVIIVASPLFRWWLHNPPNTASYMWTMCRLDALAWGALAWLVVERRPDRITGLARWAAPLCSLAYLAILAQGDDLRADHGFAVVGYSTLSITTGLVLIAITTGTSSPLHRTLEFRPLRHLGRVSYPAYLFHPMAVPIAAYFGASPLLALVVPTAVTWLVATLLHRTVEVPALSLKPVLAP